MRASGVWRGLKCQVDGEAKEEILERKTEERMRWLLLELKLWQNHTDVCKYMRGDAYFFWHTVI